MDKNSRKNRSFRYEDPPQITPCDDYIIVEPSKMDFMEISYLVKNLLAMDDFPDKNDLWILPDWQVEIALDELAALKDFSQKHYPRDITGHKTAVVSDDEITRALTRVYDTIGADLPVTFRAFSSVEKAVSWLMS